MTGDLLKALDEHGIETAKNLDSLIAERAEFRRILVNLYGCYYVGEIERNCETVP